MPIPTLITAGAGLIGAGVQNATGKNAQKRQHEYSKRLLDYQWQNSVPAMTNSLRKAGLNVGLMYSNGGPSVSGSTGSTSAPQVANPLLGLGDVINQTNLTKSASEKNLADANKTRIDALLSEKKLITEELHQDELRLKNSVTEAERKRILQAIDESKKRIESIDNEIYNRNRETDSKIRLNDALADTEIETRPGKVQQLEYGNKLTYSRYLTEEVMRDIDAQLKRENIKLTAQQISESISREDVNWQNVNNLIERENLTNEQAKKVREEIENLKSIREKVNAEIESIKSNTSLDKQRKQEMISRVISNYVHDFTDVARTLKSLFSVSKGSSTSSSADADDIVGILGAVL